MFKAIMFFSLFIYKFFLVVRFWKQLVFILLAIAFLAINPHTVSSQVQNTGSLDSQKNAIISDGLRLVYSARYNEAITYFRKLNDLDPDCAEALFFEAFVLELMMDVFRSQVFDDSLLLVVDRAIAKADEFSRPLQELVTEYCWGAIWGRPGLPRKTRSLINLGLLAALNRPVELKIHIKGALNNGCSKEEVREVLLQVCIYCGVPCAVDSFRVMAEAFKEYEG